MKRADQDYFAMAIRRHQEYWLALPPNERDAAIQSERVALAAAFFSFGHGERRFLRYAMQRVGATESKVHEILDLYNSWRAGDWTDPGVILLPVET